MGFAEHQIKKALDETGNNTLHPEAAANYIMANIDQPDEWWFLSSAPAAVADSADNSDDGWITESSSDETNCDSGDIRNGIGLFGRSSPERENGASNFPRPALADESCFTTSLRLAQVGESPSEVQRDNYVEYWHGADRPWRWACRGEPKPVVEDEAIVEVEVNFKAKAEAEDAAGAAAHAATLHGFGISVEWLLAFSFAHNCWDWPTWRVVRDIVKPATASSRCRYAQLAYCAPFVGKAAIFVSHCWGAPWGDLVLAVADCTGGGSVICWVDVFAVRQWPGNSADLDFRSVIERCTAVVVATSIEPSLSRWELSNVQERKDYLEDEDNDGVKKKLAFFRLWCIVEIAAAVNAAVPIIIKVGKCAVPRGASADAPMQRLRIALERLTRALDPEEVLAMMTRASSVDEVFYDSKGAATMLINLAFLIDVKCAECSVPSDLEREMRAIRSGVGIEAINDVARGVLRGAHVAAGLGMCEVDQAVCGKCDALDALDSSRIPAAMNAAAAGGRLSVVARLLESRSHDIGDVFGPVFRASAGGHVAVLRLLLGRLPAGRVNERDLGHKATPLLIAAQNGHSMVVQLLIESGATVTKGALSAAAQHGHVRVVAMLASPEALAEHDDDGDTALCKSAKAGHEGATNALISAGADVDASSSDGTTPLYWATRFGNLRVIAALLAAGASIETVEAAQMRGREAGRRIPFGGMHTVMAGG